MPDLCSTSCLRPWICCAVQYHDNLIRLIRLIRLFGFPLLCCLLSGLRFRVTLVKHLLASPAMFFWGLGTSSIATISFGWADTASAAILGVATIVIPAIDSFFSGPAARSTHAYVRIDSVQETKECTGVECYGHGVEPPLELRFSVNHVSHLFVVPVFECVKFIALKDERNTRARAREDKIGQPSRRVIKRRLEVSQTLASLPLRLVVSVTLGSGSFWC